MPYAISAVALALATVFVLWTAMRWPSPRADLAAGLTGGTAVALWAAFNGAHPGPSVGSLAFTAADIAALPALLAASLLMGRTVLLRHHPHPATSVTVPAETDTPEPDNTPAPEATSD